MHTRLFPAALIAALSLAQAHAAEEPAGYLVSAQDGAPVTTATGACVRTGQWTAGTSYRSCDRESQAVVPAKAGTPFIPAAVEAASSESPSPAEPMRVSMSTLFDFDSAVLRADAGPALDALAKQLTSRNYQKVDIVGHADRMGPGKYNQKLSEQRGGAVRDYLTQQGIASGSVTSEGFGKTRPVVSNDTSAGRQQNRRVELVVSGEIIGGHIGSPRASR